MKYETTYLQTHIMAYKILYHAHTFCMAKQLELSHGNLAYVMIILFIKIKLLMIDNYLTRGFTGQRHEALCKCIAIIFA